jgi:hypothetical protein
MKWPKYKKDMIGKVVYLVRPITTQGGYFFSTDTQMIIQDYDRKTGKLHLRPIRGGLIADKDDVVFAGSKELNGLSERQ